MRLFTDSGINVELAEGNGQLEVRAWEEAYLRDNHFNQYRMLELIQEVLQQGTAKGFPMTRLWANMEWALEELPGVQEIVEYETRLNEVLPNYNDVVVCTYNLNRFQRAAGDGYHADASSRHYRRDCAGKSLLRSTG